MQKKNEHCPGCNGLKRTVAKDVHVFINHKTMCLGGEAGIETIAKKIVFCSNYLCEKIFIVERT